MTRKLKLNELSVKSFVTMNAHRMGAIKGGTNNNNNGDQSYGNKCQVTLNEGECGQKSIDITCDDTNTYDCSQAACPTNNCVTLLDCTDAGMC